MYPEPPVLWTELDQHLDLSLENIASFFHVLAQLAEARAQRDVRTYLALLHAVGTAAASIATASDSVRHASTSLERATPSGLLHEEPTADSWARERAARLERLWSHLWTALDVDDCFRSHHVQREAA